MYFAPPPVSCNVWKTLSRLDPDTLQLIDAVRKRPAQVMALTDLVKTASETASEKPPEGVVKPAIQAVTQMGQNEPARHKMASNSRYVMGWVETEDGWRKTGLRLAGSPQTRKSES